MKISVGILGHSTEGWQLLLEQEGIPFCTGRTYSDVAGSSAVVVCDDCGQETIEEIRAYLSQGGGILCSSSVHARLSGAAGRSLSIKYLQSHTDPLLRGVLDIYAPCVAPVNANALPTPAGKPTSFVGESNGGYLISLPFDAGRLVRDRRTSTKSFYAVRPRLPFEHVSLVGKGTLRRVVSRALELLHTQRGIPYIHTWYFPFGKPAIFAWRIDTDYADRRQIESLHRVVENNHLPAAWFVDVKSQENFLTLFRDMAGHDIGVHCYEHQTYETYEANRRNISRAVEAFAHNGLEARYFAAPFGRWNDGIAKAISSFGFEFSSEFGYDYDNVPSFPLAEGKRSPVLQVPVHPTSIGSLRRQGFSTDEMTAYFTRLIAWKTSVREPLFFYHHPGDGHDDVLEGLFDDIRGRQIQPIRMSEYCAWWKKRIESRVEYSVEGKEVRTAHPQDDLWIRIVYPNGKEAIVPAVGSIDLSTAGFSSPPETPALPDDIDRIRKFNPWIPVIRMQDRMSRLFGGH